MSGPAQHDKASGDWQQIRIVENADMEPGTIILMPPVEIVSTSVARDGRIVVEFIVPKLDSIGIVRNVP